MVPTPRHRTPAKVGQVLALPAAPIRIPTFNSPIKKPTTPVAPTSQVEPTREQARLARLRGPAEQKWDNLHTLLPKGPQKLASFSAVPGAARALARLTPRHRSAKTPQKTPRAVSAKKSSSRKVVDAVRAVASNLKKKATDAVKTKNAKGQGKLIDLRSSPTPLMSQESEEQDDELAMTRKSKLKPSSALVKADRTGSKHSKAVTAAAAKAATRKRLLKEDDDDAYSPAKKAKKADKSLLEPKSRRATKAKSVPLPSSSLQPEAVQTVSPIQSAPKTSLPKRSTSSTRAVSEAELANKPAPGIGTGTHPTAVTSLNVTLKGLVVVEQPVERSSSRPDRAGVGRPTSKTGKTSALDVISAGLQNVIQVQVVDSHGASRELLERFGPIVHADFDMRSKLLSKLSLLSSDLDSARSRADDLRKELHKVEEQRSTLLQ